MTFDQTVAGELTKHEGCSRDSSESSQKEANRLLREFLSMKQRIVIDNTVVPFELEYSRYCVKRRFMRNTI